MNNAFRFNEYLSQNVPDPSYITNEDYKRALEMYIIVCTYLTHTRQSMCHRVIFHKIFLLLGYSQVANCFPLLKSRWKMKTQEEIWQVIYTNHFGVEIVVEHLSSLSVP